jgi:hypothetical protein
VVYSVITLSGALCDFCSLVGTSHCDLGLATACCKGRESPRRPRCFGSGKQPSAETNRKTRDYSCISLGTSSFMFSIRVDRTSTSNMRNRHRLQATLLTSSHRRSCLDGCFSTLLPQYWFGLPVYLSSFPSPATLSSPWLELAFTLADALIAPYHSGSPFLLQSSCCTSEHSMTFR